jgi:demethylmenaquinone methyltransferase/2-methoxy-6-polyprenyl-1,4-benzoquinol methylase
MRRKTFQNSGIYHPQQKKVGYKMFLSQKVQIKNYDLVAKRYAALNYRDNQSPIFRSKTVQLNEIFPGNKVLFAGSGPGEDARAAAGKGAQVTCIDVSNRMLSICAQKFNEQALEGRFINVNVMNHTDKYDVVIANFFLNVFNRKTARAVLTHLSSLLVPQGILMITDVSPLRGNLFHRVIIFFGYLSVALPAAVLGLTALHVPYEYSHFFDAAGLELKWDESFRKRETGPPLFKTWAAIKKEAFNDKPALFEKDES